MEGRKVAAGRGVDADEVAGCVYQVVQVGKGSLYHGVEEGDFGAVGNGIEDPAVCISGDRIDCSTFGVFQDSVEGGTLALIGITWLHLECCVFCVLRNALGDVLFDFLA